MQINSHSTDFRQFYLPSSNRISFELGKHYRAVLPKFFESRKPKATSKPTLESLVQSFKSILQYLRLYVLKLWQVLFSEGERPIAVCSNRDKVCQQEWCTPAYRSKHWPHTCASYPIPSFSQGVVVNTPALFCPSQHPRFLGKVWIDSVRVGQTQHSNKHILFIC